ncbi:hypothetical protein AWB71_00739 [Caballeronia peredens]|nr:hypothetical protein AWB71_00739 [Caballeronia peredens]
MLAFCAKHPLRATFIHRGTNGCVNRRRRVRQRPQAAAKPCYGDDRRPTEQARWAGFQAAAKTIAKRNRSAQRPVHRRARRDGIGEKKSSQENEQ